MGPIPGLLATCLHAAPSTFAIGFSLLLVFWLVMAEECELRRGCAVRTEADRVAPVAGTPPMRSNTA